jgi:ribosomal protein S18 acetylase RimI-like enzyme
MTNSRSLMSNSPNSPTRSGSRHVAGTSDITVRRATSRDAKALQVMLLELADHEGDGQHVHVDVDQWAQMLADPRVVVLLAEDIAGQLGYVSAVHQLNLWIGRDILALDDLYVRAGARNRGVGERLMSALARYAATEQLLIRWEMRADNDGAERFYRRLGAILRTKIIAVWPPHHYVDRVAQ